MMMAVSKFLFAVAVVVIALSSQQSSAFTTTSLSSSSSKITTHSGVTTTAAPTTTALNGLFDEQERNALTRESEPEEFFATYVYVYTRSFVTPMNALFCNFCSVAAACIY